MAEILFVVQKVYISETMGIRNLIFLFVQLLLRPWDVSHPIERQKLMVNILVEMSVCVQKGGFMANLLLH